MEAETVACLEQGLHAVNPTLSSPASTLLVSKLGLYVDEILRWSRVFNLVGQPDPKTIVQKHILDSFAVSQKLPRYGSFADLGSGAGFPGCVLAMVEPSRCVFLVEARRKRANFLKHVARATSTNSLSIFEGRIEEFAKTSARPKFFDTVVTRATWGLPEFLNLSLPLIGTNGKAAAMRGPRMPNETQVGDPSGTGFKLETVHEYVLPFGEGRRRLLVFRKGFT